MEKNEIKKVEILWEGTEEYTRIYAYNILIPYI